MRRRNKLRRFINHIHFSINEENVELSIDGQSIETPERETILRLTPENAKKFADMILGMVKDIEENPVRIFKNE